MIEKSKDFTYKAKVFTLPDVQVGSILEYRFKLRFSTGVFYLPDWHLQTPLYTVKEHFTWRAGWYAAEASGAHVAWTSNLPPGMKVKETGGIAEPLILELDAENIPAPPTENLMPPIDSIGYRVSFYYTSAKTPMEYWTEVGKNWSKDRDKFIGPRSKVRDAVKALVAPGDTDEQKVKKIYAEVMTFDNTDLTRVHTLQEDKAEGDKSTNNTDDILVRRRGNSDQLADLFVAMVRAAGIKAYLAAVTDRSLNTYDPLYLTTRQLDDYIAIVPIDGQNYLLDPGTRFCTFKHLAWNHTLTGGLRQTDAGTAVMTTPAEPYTSTQARRVADLALDEQGRATGSVTFTYTGDLALKWRQMAVREDERGFHAGLKRDLERELPGGMDVEVEHVANLADGDKPLVITYAVKGAIGTLTGKRLLLPVSLFDANAPAEFNAPKRQLAVDLHFPQIVQDAVRVTYPATMTVESAPAPVSDKIANAAFSFSSTPGPHSVTLFRNFSVGKPIFKPEEYPELRSFYAKLYAGQGETLILTRGAPSAASAAKPAGGN